MKTIVINHYSFEYDETTLVIRPLTNQAVWSVSPAGFSDARKAQKARDFRWEVMKVVATATSTGASQWYLVIS